MTGFDVVVAGNICLDIFPQVPPVDLQTALVPGMVLEIGPAQMAAGGVLANTGRALPRLGTSTCLVGRIGDDRVGKITLELMREGALAPVDYIRVGTGEASSYTLVLSPPGADRFFMHYAGTNHLFGADDVPYHVVSGARLFHFGYPPYMERLYVQNGEELLTMFRRAKETGVLTSLDMALPDSRGASGQVNWRRVLERVLPYVDFFMPSLDELLFVLRQGAPRAEAWSDALLSELAGETLAMMGQGVVLIKLGERGLYVRTSQHIPGLAHPTWHQRELWAPAFHPEPFVGATGAGDAAIAGFLSAILRDLPVEQALTVAAAVGTCNVEAADALSGIRSWDSTWERIHSGWARTLLEPQTPGWKWDAGQQVWIGPHDRLVGGV